MYFYNANYIIQTETISSEPNKTYFCYQSNNEVHLAVLKVCNRPEAVLFRVMMNNRLSVFSIVGPWQGDAPTGLMQRCRDNWEVPLCDLSDLMVATFLNQKIAVAKMCVEAEFRLKNKERDDTEYFDGQLLEALDSAKNRGG